MSREVHVRFCESGRGRFPSATHLRRIAAAHAAGFVHRDFKPENVLFGKDGIARVSDFGVVAGKLFASGYAIFSGVAFLSTIGVLMTPLAHRVLHRFHLRVTDEEQ